MHYLFKLLGELFFRNNSVLRISCLLKHIWILFSRMLSLGFSKERDSVSFANGTKTLSYCKIISFSKSSFHWVLNGHHFDKILSWENKLQEIKQVSEVHSSFLRFNNTNIYHSTMWKIFMFSERGIDIDLQLLYALWRRHFVKILFRRKIKIWKAHFPFLLFLFSKI